MYAMAVKMTRVRVDRELADDAMRVLGVKSRTEAARFAVRWILGWDRPKGQTIVQRRIESAKGTVTD